MTDIFISYSTVDEKIAQFLHQHLFNEGVQVFLASASLQPGQKWTPEILSALRGSSWVLFLASRAACASPWVQQELGAALITQKQLVPLLNLSGASVEKVKAEMTAIANRIKSDKAQGLLIAGLLVAALIAFSK